MEIVYVHSFDEWLVATADYLRKIESHEALTQVAEKLLWQSFSYRISTLQFEKKVKANKKNYIVDIYILLRDGTEIAFEVGTILATSKVYDLCQRFKFVFHLPYYKKLRIFTKENAPEIYESAGNNDFASPHPIYREERM